MSLVSHTNPLTLLILVPIRMEVGKQHSAQCPIGFQWIAYIVAFPSPMRSLPNLIDVGLGSRLVSESVREKSRSESRRSARACIPVFQIDVINLNRREHGCILRLLSGGAEFIMQREQQVYRLYHY